MDPVVATFVRPTGRRIYIRDMTDLLGVYWVHFGRVNLVLLKEADTLSEALDYLHSVFSDAREVMKGREDQQ